MNGWPPHRAVRARHRRQPRDRAAVGAEVWPGLRKPPFGEAERRRRLPAAADEWHLDEVVLTIAGAKHWLWRAVDQTGTVLDILAQSRRDAHAAKHLLRKLLKRQCRAVRPAS